MTILIKQAKIVDPSSSFNGRTADIFIENGVIQKINSSLNEKADQVIKEDNLHVSPGWVDPFAHFADPGFENKETIETGAKAAIAGGFTDVFLIPNTNPAVHDKSMVEYIVQKAKSQSLNIFPIGAITKNTDGRELAEMYDMKMSGAKAFSDGINSVQTAGIFLKALQYVKAFNGIIIQVPDDKSINPQGLMNEGIISTQLGMPGKPSIAEELIVERDIKLALYADSKIHFTGISTGCSLEQIKNAKENNGQISCSVTPYHLFFCDEELVQYDTNLKVNPPLRNTTDRDAIRKGISDGIIDCIATHHLPHEKDCKILEFENARNGMIGLETAYAVIRTAMPEITQETWVNLLSVNTRKIFQLTSAQIVEGNNATITLFNPDVKWTVTEKNIFSKSKNSPFLGRELTGKALGTLYGDSLNILS